MPAAARPAGGADGIDGGRVEAAGEPADEQADQRPGAGREERAHGSDAGFRDGAHRPAVTLAETAPGHERCVRWRNPGGPGPVLIPAGSTTLTLQGGAHETSVDAARWSDPRHGDGGRSRPERPAERRRGRQGGVPGRLQGRRALYHRRPLRRQAVPGALREPGRRRAGGQEGKPLPHGTVLTLVQYKAQVDPQGNPVKDSKGRFLKGISSPTR